MTLTGHSLGALLRERYEAIVSSMIAAAKAMNAAQGIELPEAEIRRRTSTTLDAFIASITGDAPSAYSDFWRRVSYMRFRDGVRLDHMHRIFSWSHATLRRAVIEAAASEQGSALSAIDQCVALGEEALLSLHSAYEQAKEELIAEQRAKIRELSTPILPIYTGILVLPLIGEVDRERADDMTERVLRAIVRAQARVVLIDVTGLPDTDGAVVEHLIRTARAAELLGARVIFVGIRPNTAQLLAQSDIELGDLATSANLRAGIERALRGMGLAIAPRPGARLR